MLRRLVLTSVLLACAAGVAACGSPLTQPSEHGNAAIVKWHNAVVGQTVQLPAPSGGGLLAVTLLQVVDPAPADVVEYGGEPFGRTSGKNTRLVALTVRLRNVGTGSFAWLPVRDYVQLQTISGSASSDFWGFSRQYSASPKEIGPGEIQTGTIVLPAFTDPAGKTPEQLAHPPRPTSFWLVVQGPHGLEGGRWNLRKVLPVNSNPQ
jgi:hypothetical protein